jgi:hypothetical protein
VVYWNYWSFSYFASRLHLAMLPAEIASKANLSREPIPCWAELAIALHIAGSIAGGHGIADRGHASGLRCGAISWGLTKCGAAGDVIPQQQTERAGDKTRPRA